MNSISINRQLKSAIRRMMLDYRNPLCTDLSGSVQQIKNIYALAAEHSLIYAIQGKEISNQVMGNLSNETMMTDPLKFIQLLDAFPIVARYFTSGMAIEMGDDAYRAWALTRFKVESFSTSDNPTLVLNSLEEPLKYAISKDDAGIFAEVMKVIEWSFDEIIVKAGDVNVFMSAMTELLSEHEYKPGIDIKLADFLCEISTYAFDENHAPSMNLIYMEMLQSLGYKESLKVVSERYCPIPSSTTHLCRAQETLGQEFPEIALRAVLETDDCYINLLQANALTFYKVSQGHIKGYGELIDKFQRKDAIWLQSVLIDVLKEQKKFTRSFFGFFSALVNASDNEQLLIATVNNHGWGDKLAKSMKASSAMRKHILVNELGL